MVVNVPTSDIAPEGEKVPGTGPSGFEAAIVTLSGGDACAAGTKATASTDKPRIKANDNSRNECISLPLPRSCVTRGDRAADRRRKQALCQLAFRPFNELCFSLAR